MRDQTRTRPHPPPALLSIELQETHGTKTASQKSGRTRHRAGRRMLSDLSWGALRLPRSDEYGLQASRNLTAEGELGTPDEAWGSRGGNFAELERMSRFQRLFTEVEGLVFYPSRLGEHGIDGTVNTRLFFDRESQCDWRKSFVQGAHPYLRIYVLALLKKLCALENIQHLHFHEGQFVDFSFSFTLTQTPESLEEQVARDGIAGNVLRFYRSWMHSDLEYKIGPLRGYWFAPVAYINFPWIFENWEKYVEGHDPMAEFKDKTP